MECIEVAIWCVVEVQILVIHALIKGIKGEASSLGFESAAIGKESADGKWEGKGSHCAG